MLPLSLTLILIAVIQVCQSKEKDENCKCCNDFFFLLLETISLSCKDTDAGSSECEEADSPCLVKRVGNFLVIFIVQSRIKRFLSLSLYLPADLPIVPYLFM